MVSNGDQIPGAGRFADEHGVRITFLRNALELFNLSIDRIAGRLILGANQHQLVFSAVQHLRQLIGKKSIGNHGAQHIVQSQHITHAIHLFHGLRHVPDVSGGGVAVQQQHMDRTHIEFLLQLLVGLDAVEVLRQRRIQLIIDLRVRVSVNGRHQKDQKQRQKQFVMLHNESAESAHIRKKRPMGGFHDRLPALQDHCGQHSYTCYHAEDHTLGHDNAHIQSQCKAHKAQGDKSRHRGHGAAQDRGEGCRDCMGHGLFFIVRVFGQIFPEAVP